MKKFLNVCSIAANIIVCAAVGCEIYQVASGHPNNLGRSVMIALSISIALCVIRYIFHGMNADQILLEEESKGKGEKILNRTTTVLIFLSVIIQCILR